MTYYIYNSCNIESILLHTGSNLNLCKKKSSKILLSFMISHISLLTTSKVMNLHEQKC